MSTGMADGTRIMVPYIWLMSMVDSPSGGGGTAASLSLSLFWWCSGGGGVTVPLPSM